MLKPGVQNNSLIMVSMLLRNILNKSGSWLAIVLLAVGPMAFLVTEEIDGIIWGVTVVAGLAVACTQHHRWWPDLKQNGRPVLWCLGLLALYMSLPALSGLLIDDSDFAVSRIARQLLFLGIPFVLLLLWWLRLRLQTALALLAFNAAVCGIYAFWYGQLDSGRVEGAVHAVHFGNLSLFLAFASLALLPVTRHLGWRLLAVAGFVLGISASILAGARGGWLAVPILLAVSLIMLTRAFKLRRSVIFGLLGLAILVLAGLAQTDIVRDRINAVKNNLIELSQTTDWRKNSIGVRLLMWQQAWLDIREAPLQGTGFSGYHNRIQAAVESGALPEKMLEFATEPHNEYLYQWLTRGVPGLAVFLLYLAGAGWHLCRLLLRGDNSQMAIAQAGLALWAILLIGGLTITVIDQRAVIRFLVWALALLMYCLWLHGRETTPEAGIGTASQH
jgi:O-antigen ligase